MDDVPGRYPFVAIEGTDGSGKSTLRRLLHDRLNSSGYGCFMVGQHSWLDIDAGRVILAARTQRAGIGRDELSAAFARDKVLHLRHNIIPALSTVAVLADRYFYSDAVYHEVLYGIPAEQTLAVHEQLGTLRPDAVIFVDAKPDVSYDRTVTRGMNRRAHENPETLAQLHAAYHRLFFGKGIAEQINLVHVDNNASDPELAVDQLSLLLQRLFPQKVVAHGA